MLLVSLCEDEALLALLAGEGAFAFFFVSFEGDTAGGDAELVLEHLFDGAVAAKMGMREASMDLGFFGIFGSEEAVELLFGVDFFEMGITEFFSACKKSVLHLV